MQAQIALMYILNDHLNDVILYHVLINTLIFLYSIFS